MFIATANMLDTIPAPLRDRMEIVELSSYTDEDKRARVLNRCYTDATYSRLAARCAARTAARWWGRGTSGPGTTSGKGGGVPPNVPNT